MSEKITVTRTEKLTSRHRLGVTRYHLSNGWWIDHDPRTRRNQGSPYSLWRPARSKGVDPKWIKSANSVKALLRAAAEES